uniref:R13L1/DRL21-like LRR repeat region domain-containing protein n=1 Tax=Arundo donax TaxID=35708 RepID=A0A0A8YVW6_ARUDO
MEGLRPHSRIESLKVRAFSGDTFSPTWFRPADVPTLRSLGFYRCRCLRSLSIPYLASLEQLEIYQVGIECLTTFADGIQAGSTGGDRAQHASSRISCSNGLASPAFTRLTVLQLRSCHKLISPDQILSPENLPSVKSIVITCCSGLVSMPVHSFVGFVHLQDLKIRDRGKLVCPREMILPPSLQRLSIEKCGELDRSFPACLKNLTSLTLLQLESCHNVKSIPLNSNTSTNMLKCLVLRWCRKLSSIGGSRSLSSIQHVQVSGCPKLTDEVKQPLEKKELRTKEKELLEFLNPWWRCALHSSPSLQRPFADGYM